MPTLALVITHRLKSFAAALNSSFSTGTPLTVLLPMRVEGVFVTIRIHTVIRQHVWKKLREYFMALCIA